MNAEDLLNTLQQKLKQQQAKLALAESCTGGMIASLITSQAGSSLWFDRAYITYSNQAKMDLLSVKATTLEKYGAVSQQVAQEMACACLIKSSCDYSIAVTGIAGPEGGSINKPVGTVWFSWAKYAINNQDKSDLVKIKNNYLQVESKLQKFAGDRKTVREQAVNYALSQLVDFIN